MHANFFDEYIFADGIQDSRAIRCLKLGHDALEKSELQNQIFSKLCINCASQWDHDNFREQK